jgi:crossover junction endodeoxyribonuclease RusA
MQQWRGYAAAEKPWGIWFQWIVAVALTGADGQGGQSPDGEGEEGMIRLRLPFPPSVNTMYPGNGKRRWLSKAGSVFVQQVAVAVRKACCIHHPKPGFAPGAQSIPLKSRLGLKLILNVPDKRRRDISNSIKAVEDALTKAGVWLDDEQVDKLIVERGVQVKGGECHVMIWELDTECGP